MSRSARLKRGVITSVRVTNTKIDLVDEFHENLSIIVGLVIDKFSYVVVIVLDV